MGFRRRVTILKSRKKYSKKERRRNLRNKISMAGVTYKRLKDVHPFIDL